jgi:hypothetical protein
MLPVGKKKNFSYTYLPKKKGASYHSISMTHKVANLILVGKEYLINKNI